MIFATPATGFYPLDLISFLHGFSIVPFFFPCSLPPFSFISFYFVSFFFFFSIPLLLLFPFLCSTFIIIMAYFTSLHPFTGNII